MDESIVAVVERTALEIELMMVEQPTITVIMVTQHLQPQLRKKLTKYWLS
ncbi:hypothetical protein [Fructilactobacillus cliffordii]|uniref:Uncharacterized protein n=1 Tax=Fructilactobacillus cliffordii TaxID=2940299 RepID=A0A9Q8ZTF2_9LACO|nr:hypothetical protein [Fructilactobacillus cliffordii]USS89013.1 hypothetical protein M3M40_05895 [Fructilactobacillus cliffordii]